ncbi:hypothetical protein QBC40DRAFT_286118 [Triangularia verruculosa]|uniref:Uncharacterized protein n=1 Tax=Triangularia verruculosa TaxID=2587418 RepID=A0AAN6XAK5_9PEZI|nr:hypothetical protein QBC40DRAFT_286118 [Triangularia verruculosa]
MVPPKKKVCAAPPTSARSPSGVIKTRASSPISIPSDDDSDYEARNRKGRVSLFEQLRQDAFHDLKIGLCAELDEIREETDDTIYLRRTLMQWLDHPKAHRATNHLYYRLGHTYHESSFDQFLEKPDRIVANALNDLAEEIPLEIFYTVLEREDGTSRGQSPSFLVRSLLDSSKVIVTDVPVDDRNWVQSSLPSLNPSADTFETAIVLVPRDSTADFLIEMAEGPAMVTSQYHLEQKTVQKLACWYIETLPYSDGPRYLPVFREILTKVWELNEAKGLAVLSHYHVDLILKAILKMNDFEFFEKAASKTFGRVPSDFFYWVAMMVNTGKLNMKDVEKGIVAAISTYPDAHHRCQATAAFAELSDNDSKSLLEKLVEISLGAVDEHAPGTRDGEGLVSVIGVVLGPDAICDRLGPVVEKHIKQTSFVLGVLRGLRQFREHVPTRSDIHTEFYARVTKQMVDALVVSKLFYCALEPEEEISNRLVEFTQPKPVPPGAIDADRLSEFVFSLLDDKVHDNILRTFAVKTVADAGAIKTSQFSLLWFPFLQKLSVRSTPLLSPRYRHMFSAILEAHFSKCVGSIPASSWVWSPNFPGVICGCRLCGTLKLFFESRVKAIRISFPLQPCEVNHANMYYFTSTAMTHCQFEWENGSLVAIKLLTPSNDAKDAWLIKAAKAKEALVPVNTPGVRAILGDDAIELLDWEKPPWPENSIPVPAEELMNGLPPTQVDYLLGRNSAYGFGHAMHVMPPAPAQATQLPPISPPLLPPIGHAGRLPASARPAATGFAPPYPAPRLESIAPIPAPQAMHSLMQTPAPAAMPPQQVTPQSHVRPAYKSPYTTINHPPPPQRISNLRGSSQTVGAKVEYDEHGRTMAITTDTSINKPVLLSDKELTGYNYFSELVKARLGRSEDLVWETWTKASEATRRVWVDAGAQRANLRLGVKNNVKGAELSLAVLQAKEPAMVEKVYIERHERIEKEREKALEATKTESVAKRAEERRKANDEHRAVAARLEQQGQMPTFSVRRFRMHIPAEQHARARASDLIDQKLKAMKTEADQRVQKAREALGVKVIPKVIPKPTTILPPPPVLGMRQGKLIATTPASRSSTGSQPPTPASSRALAPKSASRINSPSTKLPPIKAVKTEPGNRPAASTPRGVKRKVAEVIDLTLDDD